MQKRNTPPASLGTALPQVQSFENVTEGTWVSDTGILFRVPAEALRPGHSPAVNLVSEEISSYTRISEDSNLAIGKARQLAANADLAVRF